MRSQLRILILISLLISACNQKNIKTGKVKAPLENTIDYIISMKNNITIEFPNLYDSLTNYIENDSTEKLIIGQVLKKEGFEIINWGRGNYSPLGPRIISIEMKKDNCYCQVDKIYYLTQTDSLLRRTERIRCSDSLTFYKNKD